jgi:hypothetical protein
MSNYLLIKVDSDIAHECLLMHDRAALLRV